MSELNNELEQETNVETNFKKKHPIRNSIIFLLLFAILCAGVTAFLIYQEQSIVDDKESKEVKNEVVDVENNAVDNTVLDDKEPEKETSNVKKEVAECEGIKALDETYKINDLKITDKEIEIGKSTNGYTSKVIINYIEIEGLKDKELQQKINKRIEDKVMSMYTEDEIADEKIDRIYISATADANFANVLSINVDKDVWYFDTDEHGWEEEGINVNLINGEDITFEELFMKGAPIKTILSQAAYEALIKEVPWDEDEMFVSDISKKDYSYIEDEVFSVMNYYNTQEKIQFNFSCKYLTVYINGHAITINMADYYDQIAIYNRYKNAEDIYDGKYKNTQEVLLFTYEDELSFYYYHSFEKISDNLFVNIKIGKPDEQYVDVFSNELEKFKNDIIQKIEEYKNSNDGKARYIYADISNLSNENGEGLEHIIQIEYYEYETSEEYYKDVFYPYILGQIQGKQLDPVAPGYIYYESLDKEMKQNVSKKIDEYKSLIYNVETGEFEEESESEF